MSLTARNNEPRALGFYKGPQVIQPMSVGCRPGFNPHKIAKNEYYTRPYRTYKYPYPQAITSLPGLNPENFQKYLRNSQGLGNAPVTQPTYPIYAQNPQDVVTRQLIRDIRDDTFHSRRPLAANAPAQASKAPAIQGPQSQPIRDVNMTEDIAIDSPEQEVPSPATVIRNFIGRGTKKMDVDTTDFSPDFKSTKAQRDALGGVFQNKLEQLIAPSSSSTDVNVPVDVAPERSQQTGLGQRVPALIQNQTQLQIQGPAPHSRQLLLEAPPSQELVTRAPGTVATIEEVPNLEDGSPRSSTSSIDSGHGGSELKKKNLINTKTGKGKNRNKK